MKPHPIAVVELAGQSYEVARNGGFALVEEAGTDYYDNPIKREVDLASLFALHPKKAEALLKALVNAYGEALVKLGHAENFRKAVAGGGGE